MAAGGAQIQRPQYPAERAAARRAARPTAHLQLPAPRAVRSSLGPQGPAAAAPASLRWRRGMGPSTLSRRLNLKWTAALRQPWGAGGEGQRGRESVPVPIGPRLCLRGCSRNGARPLAAPRTARGRPAHHAGALARLTAKQAAVRPGSPPLARYRARKVLLKCSRELGRQVALSRAFELSRGLAGPPAARRAGPREGRAELRALRRGCGCPCPCPGHGQ